MLKKMQKIHELCNYVLTIKEYLESFLGMICLNGPLFSCLKLKSVVWPLCCPTLKHTFFYSLFEPNSQELHNLCFSSVSALQTLPVPRVPECPCPESRWKLCKKAWILFHDEVFDQHDKKVWNDTCGKKNKHSTLVKNNRKLSVEWVPVAALSYKSRYVQHYTVGEPCVIPPGAKLVEERMAVLDGELCISQQEAFKAWRANVRKDLRT